MRIARGPRSNGGRWPGFLHPVDGWMCVPTWGRDGIRMQQGKEANYVGATLRYPTYLNIVADQVHIFMETVFLNHSGFCQQEMVQELFEEHNKQL